MMRCINKGKDEMITENLPLRKVQLIQTHLLISASPWNSKLWILFWMFVSSQELWDTHFHQVLASEASTYLCLWSTTVWNSIFHQFCFLLMCPLSLLLLFHLSVWWAGGFRNVKWTELTAEWSFQAIESVVPERGLSLEERTNWHYSNNISKGCFSLSISKPSGPKLPATP